MRPASGCRSNAAINSLKMDGATLLSSSRKKRYSPVETLAPLFRETAWNELRALRRQRTRRSCPKARFSISPVLSGEQSSTTTTSRFAHPVASTLATHSHAMDARLYVGITTEILGVRSICTPPFLRPRGRPIGRPSRESRRRDKREDQEEHVSFHLKHCLYSIPNSCGSRAAQRTRGQALVILVTGNIGNWQH